MGKQPTTRRLHGIRGIDKKKTAREIYRYRGADEDCWTDN